MKIVYLIVKKCQYNISLFIRSFDFNRKSDMEHYKISYSIHSVALVVFVRVICLQKSILSLLFIYCYSFSSLHVLAPSVALIFPLHSEHQQRQNARAVFARDNPNSVFFNLLHSHYRRDRNTSGVLGPNIDGCANRDLFLFSGGRFRLRFLVLSEVTRIVVP